jgi:hypothetical protein
MELNKKIAKDIFKSGLIWETKKDLYTLIDATDKKNVIYTINKHGGQAEVKNGKRKDLIKLIIESDFIYSTDTETVKKYPELHDNELPKNNENNMVEVKGFLIDVEDLTLRDLVLEKPLANGQETIYCFVVDGKNRKFLVGTDRFDHNPSWIDMEKLISILDKPFLEQIARSTIDLTDVDPKDIEKRALEEISKLNKSKK